MASIKVQFPQERQEKAPGHYLEVRKRLSEQGVVGKNHAIKTKISLQRIQSKWIRYCKANQENPLRSLQTCTKADCMTFLIWILDSCRVRKRNSLCQYWKVFRMMYRKCTGREMNKNAVGEVNHFIDSSLREEYALDLSRREKPVLNVNDLLLVLQHHWVHDTETFPDERQRVQLATLLLTAAYTGARPSSLICTDARPHHDRRIDLDQSIKEAGNTLCYKHIIFLLLASHDPQQRALMVMEIDLTHIKGDLTCSKPKRFLFHEHDLLAFCPIAHVLALAFADDAFESIMARDAGHIFHAEASPGRIATPLRFKRSIQNVLIFRQATHTENGYRTSPVKALRYQVFNYSLQRLGRGTGFDQILTAYCVRRGTGNALDGLATEAVRNQVMGHQSSHTFQYYLNERIKFDVQAAFLGTPSKQALIVALGSMSRSFDHRAPTKLSLEQREALKSNATVVRLRNARDQISNRIKNECAFKTIRAAAGTDIHKQYLKAQNTLNAARRYCTVSALKGVREEFFRAIDTKDLDEQFSCLPKDSLASQIDSAKSIEVRLRSRTQRPQPLTLNDTQHHFQERSRVAVLLFEEMSGPPSTERLARRMETITNLTALCKMREVRRQESSSATEAQSSMGEREVRPSIKICKIFPNTQCLFCLGNPTLSDESREFSFSCAPAAKRHMRKQHLDRMNPEMETCCPHPKCKTLKKLSNVKLFKVHVAQAHKVKL